MLGSSFLCFGANASVNYFWSTSHRPLVFFITLECNVTLQWSEKNTGSVLFHYSVFSFLQSEMAAGCQEEKGLKQTDLQLLSVHFGNLHSALRWTLHFPSACLQCSNCSSANLSVIMSLISTVDALNSYSLCIHKCLWALWYSYYPLIGNDALYSCCARSLLAKQLPGFHFWLIFFCWMDPRISHAPLLYLLLFRCQRVEHCIH